MTADGFWPVTGRPRRPLSNKGPRLLEHALSLLTMISGPEIKQALQAVVVVDHATIEIVEVAGGETATVELHHRAKPVGSPERHRGSLHGGHSGVGSTDHQRQHDG